MPDSIDIVSADRESRGSPAPHASVVIVWPDPAVRLEHALLRRMHSDKLAGLDTIVVTAAPVDEALAAAFPSIRFIAAPADYSTARMRALGLRHAAGDVVTLISGLDDEMEAASA